MHDRYADKESASENVAISFGDGFDEYMQMLSKSTRQNIRTAKNRLAKDGKEFRLEVHAGPLRERKLLSVTNKLYTSRLFEKYRQKKGIWAFSRWFWRMFYRHIKFDTRVMVTSQHTLVAVLYVGEETAAFLSGMTTDDGRKVVVPRLAIHSAWAFYSPGYLLLTELVRYCQAHNAIREIDLTRGSERYKTDLGGTVYYTYNYTFAN